MVSINHRPSTDRRIQNGVSKLLQVVITSVNVLCVSSVVGMYKCTPILRKLRYSLARNEVASGWPGWFSSHDALTLDRFSRRCSTGQGDIMNIHILSLPVMRRLGYRAIDNDAMNTVCLHLLRSAYCQNTFMCSTFIRTCLIEWSNNRIFNWILIRLKFIW